MATANPNDENESDGHRTRRNVLALFGLAISTFTAASVGGAGSAEAHSRGGRRAWHWGWGWGRSRRDCHPHGGGGACFLSGTNILTPYGEAKIETMRVGDLVQTHSGQTRTVKRILSWSVERADGEEWSDDVAPIMIRESALAPQVPHRDLYVSPDHALYIDGVLLRAKGVVNGRSIARCTGHGSDRLNYFHLELEDHQVIVAEGAAVESWCAEGMTPCAPVWFGGSKSQVASRLRSAVSPWVDRRKTADKTRDRLEVRALKWPHAA